MKIIYDWVSISSKVDSPLDIIDKIGISIDKFIYKKGFYGYSERMVFSGISIHYGGINDGVLLEMSGQGCRDFETYGNGDYVELFDLVRDMPEIYNITRLDVAFDDMEYILPIDEISNDLFNGNYVGRIRNYNVIKGTKGTTCEIGSRKSNILIRIYDKAKERGYDNKHWIRVEIQMRDKHAEGFILNMNNIGYKFFGVINNYIRFVEPSNDSNKRRWNNKEYWDNFIKYKDKVIILEKPGIEYNFSKLQNYVINVSGNCLDTYIKCVGINGLINDLNDRKSKLTKKHEKAIEDYRRTINEKVYNNDNNSNDYN